MPCLEGELSRGTASVPAQLQSVARARLPCAVSKSSRRGTRTRETHKSHATRETKKNKRRATKHDRQETRDKRRRGVRREACDNRHGEEASEESKSLETMSRDNVRASELRQWCGLCWESLRAPSTLCQLTCSLTQARQTTHATALTHTQQTRASIKRTKETHTTQERRERERQDTRALDGGMRRLLLSSGIRSLLLSMTLTVA